MSADLQAAAAKLGGEWRVSQSGKSVTRGRGDSYLVIGLRHGRWWAGVIVSTHPQNPVKAPAPIFSPAHFECPEDAALAAERAAERWDAPARYWQAVADEWEAFDAREKRRLDDEWIARSVRGEEFVVPE